MQLCFATNNQHKLEEIAHLLGQSFELKTLQDIGCQEDIAETATTLEGNSALKAQYVWQKYNINCFADDSGLEVDALGGEPGVYSARYAGEHGNHAKNIALLLQNMQGVAHRQAQFKTIITLIINGQEWQFEGIVRGNITSKPIGTQGFGYDPVFVPEGSDNTFAQMTLDQKSSLSHRARAFKKLVTFLTEQ
jgi:XTP/dITP diphosphohydrolase